FWNTIVIKQSNDVTRLQALVDKKVVITEATIRDALRLDDAEGVDCLPNEEIFAELARMGYEKPSTKLTFYKAFFSSQWKFLIYTILQLLSAKRTSWNEFSSVMTSAVICLSIGADTAVEGDVVHEPSIPSPIPPTPPPQQSQDLPSTSQYDKVAQALEITKLKRRVKKLERGNQAKILKLRRLKKVGTSQRIKSTDDNEMEDASNQGRMTDVLMVDKEDEKKTKQAMGTGDDQVTGRQAEIYKIDMDHASKVLSVQEDEPEVQEAVDVVTTSKLITEDAAIDHDKQKANEHPLDYSKGMSYDDICPIFKAKFNSNIKFLLKSKEQIEKEDNKAIQSINETPAQKAAKRRKLNEEVEDLKQHLEIVPDEDDDVYTEATTLARKVPVVDYEIIHFNNKPHYKIVRADETHQLFGVDAAMDHEENTKCLMLRVKNLMLLRKS
nr:hypothetical protein [Tanacetum cinerariifolium]GEZ16410.1 hypothetical protein [Tanacetum cinerariifolium]